jgi:hypothetical protein
MPGYIHHPEKVDVQRDLFKEIKLPRVILNIEMLPRGIVNMEGKILPDNCVKLGFDLLNGLLF